MNEAKRIMKDPVFFPSKRRRCSEACEEHLFAIRQCTKPKMHLDIAVNFCQKIHRGAQPQENTFPEFNLDQLYYTDAFILGIDKKVVELNHQLEFQAHNKTIKETI